MLTQEAPTMSKASKKREQEAQARERLLGILKPGDTVYGIVRSVARSGMSRRIDFYAIQDNQPVFLTGSMADLGIGTWPKSGQGMIVGGWGMDMVFHCVYTLGRILWPEGGKGVRTRHGKTGDETDAGYLLRSEAL